jgi:calcineurin-like phosphoesterase family protein
MKDIKAIVLEKLKETSDRYDGDIIFKSNHEAIAEQIALELESEYKLIAEGNVDECCRQLGNWSAYRDGYYKIYAVKEEK